jgi:CRP/FNR family transcriptional regulator, anaerobic regulatory protein
MVSPILINQIIKNIECTDDDILLIIKYFKSVRLTKKEYLLEEGQVCRNLFFVEKGCLRMFYLNKKATEQIVQFALEGWWISDYFSFMDNKPSDYSIQAIEKSEIWSIDNIQFEKLLNEMPQVEKYFRIVMQKSVAAAQRRSKLQSEMSKEEFYTHFSTSFPEFMQRVPQYMIASYLGLTPEYLSELRKKK